MDSVPSKTQKRNQKRKYTGGRSEGRYGKRQRLPASAARGHPALLCSCDQHREREAVNELQELLNEYADEIFPPAADGADGADGAGAEAAGSASDGSDGGGAATGAGLSIEAELAAEIAGLKEQRASGGSRFSFLDTGCKGLVVVRINDARVDPVALVDAIFRDAVLGVQKTRYVSRLLPLQACCVAEEAQIVETAKPLLDSAFAEGSSLRSKQAAAAAATATGGPVSPAPPPARRSSRRLSKGDARRGSRSAESVAVADAAALVLGPGRVFGEFATLSARPAVHAATPRTNMKTLQELQLTPKTHFECTLELQLPPKTNHCLHHFHEAQKLNHPTKKCRSSSPRRRSSDVTATCQ